MKPAKCPHCDKHIKWELDEDDKSLKVIVTGLERIENKVDRILENWMNESIDHVLNGRKKRGQT